jgi:hypothetical protein
VNSNEVTGVNGITCCAPSLADDITCIRTTPRGLPRMLDIYTDYANKWMFDIYTEYANKWMLDIYTEYANKWMRDIYTEYANKWMFDIYT